MKASIVTIGDEILIGQIVDTNSAFIAKQLDQLGFKVVETISIADEQEAITHMLSRYNGQMDLVIMTGGLGPKKNFMQFF